MQKQRKAFLTICRGLWMTACLMSSDLACAGQSVTERLRTIMAELQSEAGRIQIQGRRLSAEEIRRMEVLQMSAAGLAEMITRLEESRLPDDKPSDTKAPVTAPANLP